MDICILQFLGAKPWFLGIKVKTGGRVLLALPLNIVNYPGSHPPQQQAGLGAMGTRCSLTVSFSDSTAGPTLVKAATGSRDAALPPCLDIISHI